MFWMLLAALALISIAVASAAGDEPEPPWVHPSCKPLPSDKTGPFVETSDGRLLIVEHNQVLTSDDDGATWTPQGTLYEGESPGIPDGGASPVNRNPLIRTRSGALVLVYLDKSSRVWGWDDQSHDATPETRNEVWAIRSLDEGRTWQDRQKLADDCIICVPTVIQTRSGRIVVPLQPYLRDPFRWAQYTVVSDDDGATWRKGNIVDVGGQGNHDGAIEAALAELSDGRVLMLLRTNLGQLWRAVSDTDGLYFREIGPSDIDASSAPAFLLRLASGRLALVWNRLDYQDGPAPHKWGGDGNYSEVPCSSQRQELSIAFSEDDGQSWSEPVVIMRQMKGAVCYPHIYERRPGELWVTTCWNPRPAVCVKLLEADFAG